ncbi:hypothetical protein B7494_g5184 [Chlorociboria aeruginascens]|nr:hypothetical protein B7494_g5184 [Chlorociboria aeruginascens]
MDMSASPGQSSPEEFDADDSNAGPSQTSPSAQLSRATAPLQKRRRVTRACDECRRKKIKCDGKQPCTHCTVYSYDCTYDQPSNRRRNPAPQYIEALESRLQRAESLLQTILPNIDLNDPNIDATILQRGQVANTNLSQALAASRARPEQADTSDISEKDAQLRSMIESTGQLDLDEQGHWDFHGGSSGTVFVQRMRQQFKGLLSDGPVLPRLPRPPASLIVHDSPRSATESPFDSGLPNTMDLPSRETALVFCQNSLDCACALLRFIHKPSFYEMFDRIYDLPPENFGNEENQFLPLLYCALALGCVFHTNIDQDPKEPSDTNYKTGIDQGVKYFRVARQLMDITECRDITSLQAVLFMILFLQASAHLSTCYSYIGIALRSALRMGLHRNISGKFTPIERETRRRAFWIVRKMDTYVSALLGFPQMLDPEDIDQELPIEVDDEYITKDAILTMPPGSTSLLTATNAHTRLMAILTKVIKYIYPLKGVEKPIQGGASPSYIISHAKIREIEGDLSAWLDKLPTELRPGGDGTPEVMRVQQLLRLAYAHVQMMLYRPFLHYVSVKSCAGKTIDQRSYACAAACVSVSRNIVHITTEMKRRGLLIGAYWFTMYTTFFAILSLVFFVLENPDKDGSKEILADAMDGKEALKGLAKRSMAADRCSTSLRVLFERLPERLKKGQLVAPKKKRSAPSSTTRSVGVQSSPDLPKPNQSQMTGTPRSATFPMPGPLQTSDLPRNTQFFDDTHFNKSPLSNLNLRHSFQDLLTPDMSATGTPDSSSTSSVQQVPHGMSPLGANNTIPDLSAMMFPSGDPFAYPNQPMMELENIKQENQPNVHPMFLSNGASGLGLFDDVEGQLFGPLPPYLMQGQQNFETQTQLDANNLMPGLSNPEFEYQSGLAPNAELNFDGIFSGDGDEWNNMITDPSERLLKLSSSQPHYQSTHTLEISGLGIKMAATGVQLNVTTPTSPTPGRKKNQMIIVSDPPKFDLESYIQNYSGRTRFERLFLIGVCSTFIGIEALNLAVAEAKKGTDIKRYVEAQSALELIAPFEPAARRDQDWIEKIDKQNQAESQRLEAELKGYKYNLVKESILLANEDIGKHYHAIGELGKAGDAYLRMRADVSIPKQMATIGRSLIEISIEKRDWITVSTNVQKVKNMQENPEQLAMQPYLRAAEGLTHLDSGAYYAAAMAFLTVDSNMGSSANTIISPNDIAVYGGLCALASMDRNDIQSRVLENSSFRTYLELEPHIRRSIQSFVNGRYSTCLTILEAYRSDYLLDIHLQKHVDEIYYLVRSKSIVQYFIPFSCVTLDSLNAAFAAPGKSIDKELVQMIQSKELDARIDTQNRLLTSVPSAPRSTLQNDTIRTAKEYEREARRRIQHMNLIVADLEVKGPKKSHGFGGNMGSMGMATMDELYHNDGMVTQRELRPRNMGGYT